MIKELKSQTGQRANPEICNRKNPLEKGEPGAGLTRQSLAPPWDCPTGTGTGKETERGNHCGFFLPLALHPVSHHSFHLPQARGEASRHRGLRSTAYLPGTATSTAPASKFPDGPLRPRDSIGSQLMLVSG